MSFRFSIKNIRGFEKLLHTLCFIIYKFITPNQVAVENLLYPVAPSNENVSTK